MNFWQRQMLNAPRVVELRGAQPAPPIPPGFVQPPQVQRLDILEAYTNEVREGKFGRQSERAAFPSTEGEQIAIFSNDHLPGRPRPLGVHLYRTDAFTGLPFNADVRARITYGCGGVQNVFDVDWLAGGQFSLTASGIRIEAITYRPDASSPYVSQPGDIIVLGALIGTVPAAQSRPITFTTPVQAMPAASSIVFPISDFARRVIPVIVDPAAGTPPNPANLTLRFNAGALTTIKALAMTAEILANGVTIPGGANAVAIENAPAAPALLCGVQYELGI
jgi:hypothetical protein